MSSLIERGFLGPHGQIWRPKPVQCLASHPCFCVFRAYWLHCFRWMLGKCWQGFQREVSSLNTLSNPGPWQLLCCTRERGGNTKKAAHCSHFPRTQAQSHRQMKPSPALSTRSCRHRTMLTHQLLHPLPPKMSTPPKGSVPFHSFKPQLRGSCAVLLPAQTAEQAPCSTWSHPCQHHVAHPAWSCRQWWDALLARKNSHESRMEFFTLFWEETARAMTKIIFFIFLHKKSSS